MSRPTAAPKTRQTAQLVGDGTTDWEAVAAGLEPRAPKQAEVIRALMQAGGPMPVAELPRQAVNALRAAGLVSVEDSRVERSPDAQTIGDESGLFLDLNPGEVNGLDLRRGMGRRGDRTPANSPSPPATETLGGAGRTVYEGRVVP